MFKFLWISIFQEQLKLLGQSLFGRRSITIIFKNKSMPQYIWVCSIKPEQLNLPLPLILRENTGKFPGISNPREVFFKKSVLEHRHLPDVTFVRRTDHLVSYNHLVRVVKQYKTTSILQLFQPTRTPFLQNNYFWLLLGM